MVNLGFGAEERIEKQQIKLDIELYFSNPPIACTEDGKGFICYHSLSNVLKGVIEGREFSLIEYLATQLENAMKSFLQTAKSQAGIDDVRYVLRLHKCYVPIDGVLDGTSYILTNIKQGLK